MSHFCAGRCPRELGDPARNRGRFDGLSRDAFSAWHNAKESDALGTQRAACVLVRSLYRVGY
eukprot:7696597-Lingulodinium_polyedra.AAC.1